VRLQIWLTKVSISTYFDLVVHHILINKFALLKKKRKKSTWYIFMDCNWLIAKLILN